ncbi:MAG: MFS transporter [Dehalococcoidales bacterium]|jgi:MFS family permease
MTALGLFSITTSGFLAAFALALGANNLQIGILAAIPFLTQILQLPSIWLVEKIRRRKAITLITSIPTQLLWFVIALIPFFLPTPGRSAISLLLVLMGIRGLMSAVGNCSWNGWVRDLIPQEVLGRIFSKRLILSTITAVVFSLGAAFFVDFWQAQTTGYKDIFGYSYVLLFGALFLGMASPLFLAFIPEPLMQTVPGNQPSISERLSAPFRNRNFRQLIMFLFSWGFISNLAVPFFAVYMLKYLGLPLSLVIGLSILSQLFNISFLRIWGRFVDRFSNKTVLSLCASLYLLVIFGWAFTDIPGNYLLSLPLLTILHIFAGIANAGITLTIGTIGLKLAPQGEATSYLASASLATNLGTGLGPLCGGLLGDFFSTRNMDLTFTWSDPALSVRAPLISLTGLDFLFVIAFVVGLMILGILARIREEGEVSREVILESLMLPTREISRPMSSVPGYNLFSNFPFGYIKKIPVPGLDAAIGVTTFQIAEVARATTMMAMHGHKITKMLIKALQDNLNLVFSSKEAKTHGVEMTREAVRGAMRGAGENYALAEDVVIPLTAGVVKASSKAGIDPLSGIQGASQGVVEAAIEMGDNLTASTIQVIKAARDIAKQVGISEESAVVKASVGALEAAHAAGPEVVEKVKAALHAESYSQK